MNIVIWQTLSNIVSRTCSITVGGSFLHVPDVLVHYCLRWLGLRVLSEHWMLIWDAQKCTHVINVDNGGRECMMKLNVCRPCGTLSAPCSSFSALSRFRSPAIGTAQMSRSHYSHKTAERCSCVSMRKLTSRHGLSPVHCGKWINMLRMLLLHR